MVVPEKPFFRRHELYSQALKTVKKATDNSSHKVRTAMALSGEKYQIWEAYSQFRKARSRVHSLRIEKKLFETGIIYKPGSLSRKQTFFMRMNFSASRANSGAIFFVLQSPGQNDAKKSQSLAQCLAIAQIPDATLEIMDAGKLLADAPQA